MMYKQAHNKACCLPESVFIVGGVLIVFVTQCCYEQFRLGTLKIRPSISHLSVLRAMFVSELVLTSIIMKSAGSSQLVSR